MNDCGSSSRRWEDLDMDMLVEIFKSCDIFELVPGIALVCRAWHRACFDPFLWRTLDLSTMMDNYNFIKIPFEPYVYVDSESDKRLTRGLKISLSLSQGQMETLIFHFNMFVSDDQLTYTAERCPQLRRLVLPAWNRITRTRMCEAIRTWRYLESLTMPSITNPANLMEEISRSCENFRELKIMGPCDILFASDLCEHLPRLRVLSLRCTMLSKDALLMILDSLPELEVLNISHCVLIDAPPPPAPRRIIRELDQSILQRAYRLQEFLTCMDDQCIMCQRTKKDEGLMRWYSYEKNAWKLDEVPSLAL